MTILKSLGICLLRTVLELKLILIGNDFKPCCFDKLISFILVFQSYGPAQESDVSKIRAPMRLLSALPVKINDLDTLLVQVTRHLAGTPPC